jgi:hypothetical protein
VRLRKLKPLERRSDAALAVLLVLAVTLGGYLLFHDFAAGAGAFAASVVAVFQQWRGRRSGVTPPA